MTVPAESETGASVPWGLIIAGLAVIAGIVGLILGRRRKGDGELVSTTYVATDEDGAPVPAVDLTERPWIRLMLQPQTSETRGGSQVIGYDLIVENEGHVPAHDVLVSSFLARGSLTDPAFYLNSDADSLTIDVPAGASVPLSRSFTVREGEEPKIVADARYPLPDGGEGHLAARFGIDFSDDEVGAHVEDVLERV